MSVSTTKRPTIRDVAREAGVSHATVSRVINGGKWVGADAQKAVEQAIARTGYLANQQARSLATGRSGIYVFLLTEPQELLFEDPNFAILVRAATDALAEDDLAMVLMAAGNDGERRRAISYVQGGHVDGVLLVSPHDVRPLVGELLKARVPVVCNGDVPGHGRRISVVTGDDADGARQAVEHLATSGRSRIATITGPSDAWGTHQRLDAYHQVLRAHGLDADPELVAGGDWSRRSGEAAMAQLLAQAPNLDAVFAGNDMMAAGAMDVLRAAGRRVPDEVAVVGFDDTGLAETLDPPLTTVHAPLGELSREMVRLVTDSSVGPVRVTIPTHLVVRESSTT